MAWVSIKAMAEADLPGDDKMPSNEVAIKPGGTNNDEGALMWLDKQSEHFLKINEKQKEKPVEPDISTVIKPGILPEKE